MVRLSLGHARSISGAFPVNQAVFVADRSGDLRRHQLRVGGPSRGIMPRRLNRRAAGTVVEADLAITQCEQVWSMKSSTAADDVEQLHSSAPWTLVRDSPVRTP